MIHTRWCHDMTGEEYARIYSWGNDPKRRGEYEDATPSRHIDLPQTVFEPIVVEGAMAQGWNVRFSTSFQRFEEQGDGSIVGFLKDDLTNTPFVVKSRYLFGCDGAIEVAHSTDNHSTERFFTSANNPSATNVHMDRTSLPIAEFL
jgi:2-polyprenyl-6-methoxyphenol hydroxylase-like FAD-dependent oxidoreductase